MNENNSPFVTWLVPDKILVVTPDNELNLEQSDLIFKTLDERLDNSPIKVGVVADLNKLSGTQKGIMKMLSLESYKKFVEHPKLGKQGVVNVSNNVVQLIIKFSKVFGAPAQFYTSLDEAKEDMLKSVS